MELAIPGSAVECFTTEPNPLAPEMVRKPRLIYADVVQ